MLLETFGFLSTSLLAGIYLVYKLTGDLYPKSLKKFLYSLALKAWRNNVPQRQDPYNLKSPKSTEDYGMFPSKKENELETPKKILKRDECDDLLFYGIDDDGNILLMRNTRFYGGLAEGNIILRINGKVYTATCMGQAAANDFAVGTMKLEVVEAMRSWRLWYNGPLRDEENSSFVHAAINILWKPLNGPTDLQKNANIQLLSEHLATGGSFGDSLFDLRSLLPVGYRQFSTLHGTIKFNGVGDEDEKQLYLYGNRIRRQLTLPERESVPDSSIELFAMCGNDGNAFSLSANKGVWTDGTSYHVSGREFPVEKVEATAEHFNHDHSIPKLFTFQGNAKSHTAEFWPTIETESVGVLEIVPLTLAYNTGHSRGILIRNLNNASSAVLERLEKVTLESESTLGEQDFVDLESSDCLNVSLVGGKGASLAALAKSSASISEKFETSPGFCVTTHFFRRILNVEQLETIFRAVASSSDLDAACKEAQNMILTTGVEDKIEPLVSVWINKTFVECQGGKFSRVKADKFAVRSSGTLEDGADLSCAGQNETFLGVKEENIAKKVVECWASLFSSQSVRYRLNHGQPAVSDMGVVVQAMVNATAAGVIFSADPITGNPFNILINANYGLGESVVSASCDPDTIRVAKSHDGSSTLSIGRKVLGRKESKVVLNDNGTASTHEVRTSEEEAQTCCISDSIALKLAAIAVQLVESNDGKPLDIEWAVEGEQIYILQSRNITSLDAWTDFEIIHEFDTPLRTQFETLTTANVGEVMPGVISPLSMSVVTKGIDVGIQRRFTERYNIPAIPQCFVTMAIARERLFINILQTMYRHNDAEIQPSNVCVDLAVCGHVVLNDELHAYAIQRWGVDSAKSKISSLFSVVKNLLTSKRAVKAATANYATYRLNVDSVKNDSAALFKLITDKMMDLIRIAEIHCILSEASTSCQVITFTVLSEQKKPEEWEASLYQDVSKITAVCSDVESADIPTAMDTLAKAIVDEGDEVVKIFTGVPEAEALEYLLGRPALRNAYDEFMGKHGHRGVVELDLMRQSWKTEPLPFITLLKSIVASKSHFKDGWKKAAKVEYPTTEAVLDALETPIKNSTRKVLKFILPYCRSSVWNREKTKSLLVGVANQFKLAYNVLGEQLVRDQLISNPKLVYFFTHYELSQIISRSHSSPRILYKAMRREKLHRNLDNEKYPEFSKGIPEPIDDSIPVELGDQIKATPVSSGKVQGVAKVCLSLDEAAELVKPGDILITHGTDIGWSPFFPMLGGVVTELGGLISHGAVVAREYGLPCIVGASHATKIFKTGDLVLLNANEGTLSKVKTERETSGPSGTD